MGCYNNNNRKVNSRKIWQFENFFFFIWPKSDLKLPISDGVITLPPLPHPPIHTLFTELNGILSPTEPEYRRIESRRTDQRNLEPGLGDIISSKHGTIGIYSYLPTFNMELGDIISPKHGTFGIYSYPPTFNMELGDIISPKHGTFGIYSYPPTFNMELGDIISPKHGTIGIYSYPPTFNMELGDIISPKHGTIGI